MLEDGWVFVGLTSPEMVTEEERKKLKKKLAESKKNFSPGIIKDVKLFVK